MTHSGFIKLDIGRSDTVQIDSILIFPSSSCRVFIFTRRPLFQGTPSLPLPPPLLSPLFLLHLSSSSSCHFPGATTAAASVSSVRRSAAMVDSPGAMNKVSAVPEIKPLNQYDFSRAKICASVRWLLSKSYGSAGTRLRGGLGGAQEEESRERF